MGGYRYRELRVRHGWRDGRLESLGDTSSAWLEHPGDFEGRSATRPRRWLRHDFLLIDVTTMDNGVGGDMWSPSWRQIIPVINSNQGGWQQTQFDYPVAADDGGSLTAPSIVLDLNTVANTDPVTNPNGYSLKAMPRRM